MIQAVSIRTGAQVARRAREFGGDLNRALATTSTEAGLVLLATWQRRLAGTGTGDTLRSRTGNTRRQLRVSAPRTRGDDAFVVVGAAGTSGRILRAHEEGKTIRPRLRQWLTIPMGAAKTRAGVARGPARSFPDAFFVRGRGGGQRLFIVREKTKGAGKGSLELLFVLVKRVKLPKRRTAEASKREAEPKIVALFRGAVSLAVRKANG
jgi:hypothetical protein